MKVKIYTGSYCTTCGIYEKMLEETKRDIPELEIELIDVQISPIERELEGVPANEFEDNEVIYGPITTDHFKQLIKEKICQ